MVWAIRKRHTPPAVPFTLVQHETLVSTLPTNGKVEPFEWQAVHAQAEGLVTRVNVTEGAAVARDAVLAVIADPAPASPTSTPPRTK